VNNREVVKKELKGKGEIAVSTRKRVARGGEEKVAMR